MKSSIAELKTDWTDRKKALYWLKTMAENPYNDNLRVLWTALQIVTEKHPAEIPF